MKKKNTLNDKLRETMFVIVRYADNLTFTVSDVNKIVADFTGIDVESSYESRPTKSPIRKSLNALSRKKVIRKLGVGYPKNSYYKQFALFGGVTMHDVKKNCKRFVTLAKKA